jgi:signal peptidase I
MTSTIVLVASFLGLLLLAVLPWAIFLWLGLRWAQVPDITLRRIVVTTILVGVVQLVISFLIRIASPASNGQQIVFLAADVAAAVLVPCLVIKSLFRVRFLRALQAWLPTLVPSLALAAFVFLVLRPFLFESFTSPTNGMAPTLLGRHWRSECPECGQSRYCSPAPTGYLLPPAPKMICEEFHVTVGSEPHEEVHPPDRFFIAKFLSPQRWDLVVFRFPQNPETLYVMRLVGLPGETIHIEDGAVWADGERLTPPDYLDGIEYVSEMSRWPLELSGTKANPAVLGDDEYFVLGDFSVQSMDSRFWEQGAPGHPPYAVPASHIEGIVTHIYWPPSRWRVLR